MSVVAVETAETNDSISILTAKGSLKLCKIWDGGDKPKPYDDVKSVKLQTRPVSNIRELSKLLKMLEEKPKSCIIRGKYVGDERALANEPDLNGSVEFLLKRNTVFEDQRLHALCVDVDGYETDPLIADPLIDPDPVRDPERAIQAYITDNLPAEFHGCTFHWQLSGSAGHPSKPGLNCHIWFWLDEARSSAALGKWAKTHAEYNFDKSLYQQVKPHYTARPIFEAGAVDPVPVRSGLVRAIRDSVSIDIEDVPPGEAVGAVAGLTEISPAQLSDLRSALAHPGLRKAAGDEGICTKVGYGLVSLGDETGQPLWLEFCANASDDSSNPDPDWPEQWWRAHRSAPARSDFRAIYNLASEYGWVNPITSHASEPASSDDLNNYPVSIEVGQVPKALHLCTDQANAGRIMREYDGQLISSAGGRFYAWTGKHWKSDDGEARRFSCGLSEIVRRESKLARKKADRAFATLNPESLKAAAEHPRKNALAGTEDGKIAMQFEAAAEALEKWSTACESKKVQDSALGLLRDLIKLPESELDKDPYLLNCENGVIDLRTGQIREHQSRDYLTKICPVDYDPAATAPRFEVFVSEIMRGDSTLVKFVQRWFGYCATGDVREQCFVVHIGAGANGKGTLLNAVQGLLGEYATTAPLGLLTSPEKAHGTETAELFGRRLVTAHEPDENASLREGFVKTATGGDTLSARWLYKNPFTFAPTHKLQLLTNHKPQIKGTDFGIWRRVLLLPYALRFGSAEDVADGRADRLRDDSLASALFEERKGIFRWLVQGAVEWYAQGLKPPDAVRVAVADYQREQDRVGEFVTECCQIEREGWTPVVGMYSTYQQWAKDAGYVAMGRNRFLGELERVVPFFKRGDDRNQGTGKDRRSVRGVTGIRLLPPEFEGLV
jgi:putative DNA primase/helicase